MDREYRTARMAGCRRRASAGVCQRGESLAQASLYPQPVIRIGHAFAVMQQEAMRLSHANDPIGKRYNEAVAAASSYRALAYHPPMNAPRHLRARAMIVTAISPPERTEVVAHHIAREERSGARVTALVPRQRTFAIRTILPVSPDAGAHPSPILCNRPPCDARARESIP